MMAGGENFALRDSDCDYGCALRYFGETASPTPDFLRMENNIADIVFPGNPSHVRRFIPEEVLDLHLFENLEQVQEVFHVFVFLQKSIQMLVPEDKTWF